MSISSPGESPEYRVARDRLLQQEVELRRATEAVAADRRELAPGGVVPQDYVFQQAGPGGTPTEVRLSELFVRGLDTLVIYNFMFPRALDDEGPCPHCTSMLDALDGAAQHITQRVNFAVVAKAPLPRILAHAHQRGWRGLQLLSSAGTTYNRDYFGEDAACGHTPLLNMFQRDGAAIPHFWGSELLHAPTQPGQAPPHPHSIDPHANLSHSPP